MVTLTDGPSEALIRIIMLIISVPLLGPAGSAEDERRVSPALGVHCKHQCGKGSAETGTTPSLMRAMLRAFRAAHLHHLLTIHKDEQRPCLFGTQSPAHHRYHHPQRWVKLTTAITSFILLAHLRFARCALPHTKKLFHFIYPKEGRGGMAQAVIMCK